MAKFDNRKMAYCLLKIADYWQQIQNSSYKHVVIGSLAKAFQLLVKYSCIKTITFRFMVGVLIILNNKKGQRNHKHQLYFSILNAKHNTSIDSLLGKMGVKISVNSLVW